LTDKTSNIPLAKYGMPEEVPVVVEQLLGAFSDHMTGANLLQTADSRARTERTATAVGRGISRPADH